MPSRTKAGMLLVGALLGIGLWLAAVDAILWATDSTISIEITRRAR